MDDEDFELQPLDGCDEDEDDVDAKNLDTFGNDGALGDDWEPDANALGAFEAMRIATQQKSRWQQQGPSSPPYPYTQAHRQTEVPRESVDAAERSLLQPQEHQRQHHVEPDTHQRPVSCQRQGYLWQQMLLQQQQQSAGLQRQQHQTHEHTNIRTPLQARVSAAGTCDSGNVSHTPSPFLDGNFQSSTRSTVTEQLNRLIAFKRQQQQQQQQQRQQQQQASSRWLSPPTTAGPTAGAPVATSATSFSAARATVTPVAHAAAVGGATSSAAPAMSSGNTGLSAAARDTRPACSIGAADPSSIRGETSSVGSTVRRPTPGVHIFDADTISRHNAAGGASAGALAGGASAGAHAGGSSAGAHAGGTSAGAHAGGAFAGALGGDASAGSLDGAASAASVAVSVRREVFGTDTTSAEAIPASSSDKSALCNTVSPPSSKEAFVSPVTGARHDPAVLLVGRPPPGLEMLQHPQHQKQPVVSSPPLPPPFQQQQQQQSVLRQTCIEDALPSSRRVFNSGTVAALIDAAASAASGRVLLSPPPPLAIDSARRHGLPNHHRVSARTGSDLLTTSAAATEGAVADDDDDDDQRDLLQLLKNTTCTAATFAPRNATSTGATLAARNAVDVSGAAGSIPVAREAVTQQQQHLQVHLRELLELSQHSERAKQLLQELQELHQLYLQQCQSQEQQRQEIEHQQLLGQQEATVHEKEQQERFYRQQQRLAQFLRPSGYAGGVSEAAAAAADDDTAVGRTNITAAEARSLDAAGGPPVVDACVREHFQQQDSRTLTPPASVRLLWGAASPSRRPSQQSGPPTMHQQPVTAEQQLRQLSASSVSRYDSPPVTRECAPAVGASVARVEAHSCMHQQDYSQQQMIQGAQHRVADTSVSGISDAGDNDRKTEKKVFVEAEVLQILAAATRNRSERAALSAVHTTPVAMPQVGQECTPFPMLHPLQQQPQEAPPQQPRTQQQQITQDTEAEEDVLQQELDEERQQQQHPSRECEKVQQELLNVQQRTPQQLSENLIHPGQEQQYQATKMQMSGEEASAQPVRECVYTSSGRGEVQQERRQPREMQLPEVPAHTPAPLQQRQEPTSDQQQKQPQHVPETQYSGRSSHVVGPGRNSDVPSVTIIGEGADEVTTARISDGAPLPVGRQAFSGAAMTTGTTRKPPYTSKSHTAPSHIEEPLSQVFHTASSGGTTTDIFSPPLPVACTSSRGMAVADARGRACKVGGKAVPSRPAGGRASFVTPEDIDRGNVSLASPGGPSTKTASALRAIRASGLFPLTKAHCEMAIEQQLKEMAPWRLPRHMKGDTKGDNIHLSASRRFSRNGHGLTGDSTNHDHETGEKTRGKRLQRGGSTQKLMTSFDLEYILRLQLTSMAKVPQLQLISGRWNFRYLRSQSSASAGTCQSRALSPSQGESGTGGGPFDHQPPKKVPLPTLPVEMERYLLRMLPGLEAGRLHLKAVEGDFSSTGVQSCRDVSVSKLQAMREADYPVIPPVLEKKLHGGVGITVVDGSTRMHRLLLGSITPQEATNMLEHPQPRQSSALSRREEASAADDCVQKGSNTSWSTPFAASPSPDVSPDVDVGPLEPLEYEHTGENDVAGASEDQQQQQMQQRRNAAEERQMRRLQKRFGKQTYCSVRQPRSSIYVGGATSAFATVDEEDSEGDDEGTAAAFSIGTSPVVAQSGDTTDAGGREKEADTGAGARQQLGIELMRKSRSLLAAGDVSNANADEKVRRRLLRSLMAEGNSGARGAKRGAASEDLLGLTVMEDAIDILLQAAALEEELLECPATHITARGRLVEQQEHLMLQLFELLLLRRHVRPEHVSDRGFLYLADFHPPACTADVEEYVRVFERLLQQQEQLQRQLRAVERQREPSQESGSLRETTTLLERETAQLQATLTTDLEDGRSCSRWMLSRIYSKYKGRQLLLRSLLLLPDPQAAALVQGLCSNPTILYNLCVAVDAALVPADQLKGSQQQEQQRHIMANAFPTLCANAATAAGARSGAEVSAPPPDDAGTMTHGVATPGHVDTRDLRQRTINDEELLEARARLLTVASAALLEELVLLLEVEGSNYPSDRCDLLLKRLADMKATEPFAAVPAEMYVQIIQVLLRLGSSSDSRSAHFITGVAQHIIWGLTAQDLVRMLEWRSGCCFLSCVVALLPPPSTLTPLQHKLLLTVSTSELRRMAASYNKVQQHADRSITEARDFCAAMEGCLELVVSALLMTVYPRGAPSSAATESHIKRQDRNVLLAPLVQTIVQQARPYECRAKLITNVAVFRAQVSSSTLAPSFHGFIVDALEKLSQYE